MRILARAFVALVLFCTTVTSGIAARCTMLRACGHCPEAGVAIACPAPDCPHMTPASPRIGSAVDPGIDPGVAPAIASAWVVVLPAAPALLAPSPFRATPRGPPPVVLRV